MIDQPNVLIRQFQEAVAHAKLGMMTAGIAHEVLRAPHTPRALPLRKCAVYVFSLSSEWGRQCSAGAGFVLKVGKVGVNSNPRFQYQHYNPRSAGSTVARSLINTRILWFHLGIADLSVEQVGRWLRENTDRDHFYLDEHDKASLSDLERLIRGLLGPAFEGG